MLFPWIWRGFCNLLGWQSLLYNTLYDQILFEPLAMSTFSILIRFTNLIKREDLASFIRRASGFPEWSASYFAQSTVQIVRSWMTEAQTNILENTIHWPVCVIYKDLLADINDSIPTICSNISMSVKFPDTETLSARRFNALFSCFLFRKVLCLHGNILETMRIYMETTPIKMSFSCQASSACCHLFLDWNLTHIRAENNVLSTRATANWIAITVTLTIKLPSPRREYGPGIMTIRRAPLLILSIYSCMCRRSILNKIGVHV